MELEIFVWATNIFELELFDENLFILSSAQVYF
jgi:hypothetical protein